MVALNLVQTGGSCVDDVLATVSTCYNRRYELMYLQCLNFSFDRNKERTFGERMHIDLGDYFQLMGHYHGYHVTLFRPDFQGQYELLFDQLRRGNPVAVFVDSYYIPWDVKFMKFHEAKHMIILIGYNEEEQYFSVADPFFNHEKEQLSFELFSNAYRDIVTFEAIEGDQHSKELLLDQLCSHMERYVEGDRPFEDMKVFADQLTSLQFEHEEVGYFNYEDTSIHENLSRMVRGREYFAKALKYIDECYNFPQLQPVITEFINLSIDWAAIRASFIKLRLMQQRGSKMYDSTLESTANNIRKTAELEQALTHKLLKLLRSNGDEQASFEELFEKPDFTTKYESIQYVNLSRHFNNRGIESSQFIAEIDADGYYFSLPEKPQDKIVKIENLSFYMDWNGEQKYDNVICSGQSIELEQDFFDCLMYMGCCEFGSYRDYIQVEYADGSLEKHIFGFSDWWEHKPINHEIVAWSSTPSRHGVAEVTTDEVRLYANVIQLNPAKKLVNIILPNQPNTHLFALSLAQV